jgi:hypothetical protein
MQLISRGTMLALGVLFALVNADGQVAFPAQDPQTLVRIASGKAVANAQDTQRLFMYRVLKESSSGAAVRDIIETKDVILARTLTWNGRQLTPEERMKEEAKLDLVMNSTAELKSKQEEQEADRKRTLAVVRALPEALIFRYAGMEMLNGRQAIKLTFTPNPNFDPTSKETYGLKAAAGALWIDKEQTQIVKMDAALTENVYIGWGILGHINKGGHLELEQTLLPGNAWRISKLNIDATGKAFFFKTIKIMNRQTGWDYRPVPANLSIAQAVQTLRMINPNTVQRAATP